MGALEQVLPLMPKLEPLVTWKALVFLVVLVGLVGISLRNDRGYDGNL